MFYRNAWYAGARDEEVGRALYATSLLGERVVLYRTQQGEPVALEDACPHRKLPLSMGRLQEDAIECGYHGLTFHSSGRCIRVPGSARIPPTLGVRSYPAVSRHGLIWLWMGEAHRADPSTIMAVEYEADPRWGRGRGGVMTVDCGYLFLTDNLLDPSHVAWVHPTSFGDAQTGAMPVQVTTSTEAVVASRWMYDVEVAPFYAPLVGFQGRADRLQHYEVRYPSHALIRSVFCPAGSGGPDRPLHPLAMRMDSYNFLTPIDEHRTRYFWFQTRNFAPRDEAVSAQMDEAVRQIFEEDRRILAAVDAGCSAAQTAHVDLAIDRAPLLFRRRLAQLIAAQQETAVAGAD